MWLAWSILYQPPQASRPGEEKLSPVLTSEQRKRLSTYHRRCSSSSDCEPPLGCLYDLRFPHEYCADSECVTDGQCQEGEVCRVLTTIRGPWVRQCVALGLRAEGERCFKLPPKQEDGCRTGLVCAGRGWCGRTCRKDVPSSCPEGFFCADLEPEPACLPTCEKSGCPAGQECFRTPEDGASTCVVVHGSNCQQTPCPPEHWCAEFLVPQRPHEAWMRCVQRCGEPHQPLCPEGDVCYRGSCERRCSPEQPNTCGSGLHCVWMPTGKHWLCKPEWYRPN
jgi:hypothetical protein